VFGLGYNSVKAEGGMENWKVALVSGAAGVGTAMFLKKKWTAGIILAGVGLARQGLEHDPLERLRNLGAAGADRRRVLLGLHRHERERVGGGASTR
jgi:hypothetical protein